REEGVVAAGLGRPHPVVSGVLGLAGLGRGLSEVGADSPVDLHGREPNAPPRSTIRSHHPSTGGRARADPLMTVLDAYAAIACGEGEAPAVGVEPLLRGPATLTALGVAEVIDHLVRVRGRRARGAVVDL